MTEQLPNPPAGGEQSTAPVHRGPPIVIADEVLDERGQQTAVLLKAAVGKLAVGSGGRDDLPWVVVKPADLLTAATQCKDSAELAMDMLHLEFAVDYEDHIQMQYVLMSVANNRKVILRTDIPGDAPKIDTVTGLWEAAGWYEREAHDLFGVEFTNSPDMSPLLLYEGFEGHPGLKSYPFNDYQEW